MVLNNEGESDLIWCFIGIAIGVLIGTACTYTTMHDDITYRKISRNSLWQEAVVRNYAEQFETEDGKPAYRWKEK